MGMQVLEELTVILPYYRNVAMLRRQFEELNKYPEQVKVIIVDDGSPEPAEPIVRECASPELLQRLELYRVDVNIPWNREGARNLASKRCTTEWMLHLDIDHVMPVECINKLLGRSIYAKAFYRVRRFRVGKADETRRKDTIPPDQEYGEIKPHIDSYLVRRKNYWQAGGYNEDFAGILGGGTEFLRRMADKIKADLLPPDIHLHVYTRHTIPDSSDMSLSRDTSMGKELSKKLTRENRRFPTSCIRFPWSKVI